MRKQPVSRHTAPNTGALRKRYSVAYLGPWRACANLTMAALAIRAGVTERTVFLMEHGQRMPHLATVQHIAEALGIPPDVLMRYPPTAEEAREYVITLAYRAAAERMTELGISSPDAPDAPAPEPEPAPEGEPLTPLLASLMPPEGE